MGTKIEKKTVFNANDMIDYADGGVVSKEFIHNDSGSVTLFAFDEGQHLSPHKAPYDALLQIIDGEADIMIEGEHFTPRAGESLIIPQGALHAVDATRRFKMQLTMIRG